MCERGGVPTADFGGELLFFGISYRSGGTCVFEVQCQGRPVGGQLFGPMMKGVQGRRRVAALLQSANAVFAGCDDTRLVVTHFRIFFPISPFSHSAFFIMMEGL